MGSIRLPVASFHFAPTSFRPPALKISRDFLLLGSVVGVLAAATVFYWSHHQVELLSTANIEFVQARTTRRAALQDATMRLGHLKAQLIDAQREDRLPPTYEEWSRQQAEARADITLVRQRFAELEPALGTPLAPQPSLVHASAKVRELSGKLLANWKEFEQRGSGLTDPSREYANSALLPLIADELQPAIEELAAADSTDAERRTSGFPAEIALAERLRLGAVLALAACFGLLIYTLVPRRKTSPKLLSAAWKKSGGPEPDAAVAANFEHNVAAMDPNLPKILVAEHNPADSDTLSLLLTNASYAVIGCDNGKVARDAIQRIPFALLLLDLRLPEHGGAEILRAARKLHPEVPAILICDEDDDTQGLESTRPPLTHIVRRPLNPRTLLWSVSEVLYPGENRQPREYSRYVPELDDDPSAPAQSVPLDTAFPISPRTVTPPAPPPPPPPPAPPAPPPEKPVLLRRSRPPESEPTPAPAATPAPAIEPPAPVVEPTAPRRNVLPPPEASPVFVPPTPAAPPPPPPVVPAQAAPDAPSPAAPLTAAESSPDGTQAPFVRKKIVRRKIQPTDGE